MSVTALWLLALLLAGCGGTPTGPSATPAPQPSPAPTPAPAAFTGIVTNTVTGAPVPGFTAVLSGSRVTVSAPGYLTREMANGPAVDLIHNAAPFDLAFYRQMVRNGLESPSALQSLQRRTLAPSVYLHAAGLAPAAIASLEHAARVAVFEWSGHQLSVVSFVTGDEIRPSATGWISIALVPSLEGGACGASPVGGNGGLVRLSLSDACHASGYGAEPRTLMHEIGHAMGFWHVNAPGSMMATASALPEGLSESDRYHAAIAYKRPIGNRDVDADQGGSSSVTRVVID